jgi:hypothetical protein
MPRQARLDSPGTLHHIIIRGIEQGQITKNFIEPSFELLDTLNGYWQAVMPVGSKTSMAYHFPRLKTVCREETRPPGTVKIKAVYWKLKRV